ncbi:MAG: phage tail protein [Streptosporangiaceae bacterium]
MTMAPFTAFRFEVVLDLENPVAGITSPLCDAAFAECEGLEMTMEPKTIESGGVNNRQIHLIGPVKFSQLTLKRGMTSNLQLWSWLALTARGTVAPASGTVTMWDTDSTPVIEFALQGCLPVRMRGPSLNAREGLVAVEELALVYETMSVTAAGTGGLGAGTGAGIGVSAGFSAGASAGASVSGGVSS